jgi:hypothetical protein
VELAVELAVQVVTQVAAIHYMQAAAQPAAQD